MKVNYIFEGFLHNKTKFVFILSLYIYENEKQIQNMF